MNRYEIDSSETKFQAGSDDQVLANKLGITDPAEVNDIEAFLLSKLYQQIFAGDISHCQTLLFQDIARWHRQWLGNVYDWEGNGRISRLLIDFISNSAGLGLLDYSLWDKHKDFYIASIQAGISRDYQHIERLVRDIVN